MANPLGPIVSTAPVLRMTPAPAEGTGPAPVGRNFSSTLADAVRGINEQQKFAQNETALYANGDKNDVHGTMIATAEADISLRFIANVRNRLVEAYREVMRMGA